MTVSIKWIHSHLDKVEGQRIANSLTNYGLSTMKMGKSVMKRKGRVYPMLSEMRHFNLE